MADSKLTALTELTAAEPADILYIVDDPAGSPVHKKISMENILAYQLPYAGKIAGAFMNGDPNHMMNLVQAGGVTAATPTNIGTSTARCSFFKLPFNLTVNKIRFFGIGAHTNVMRVAIYRYSDLARLTTELAMTTSVDTWGSVGNNLGLTLTKGVQYFIAAAVNATSTTAAVACFTTAVATTAAGRMLIAPGSLPGHLDMDSGFFSGMLAQFAVSSGALPDPAATLAGQGGWSGGMPAFWLDNSNA
jgi:hypothetical protein